MRKFLERYGWKRISAQKNGCFKTVLWLDRKTGQVYPQHMAVEVQRSRNKYDKGKADAIAELRADAVALQDQSGTGKAGAVDAVEHDCIHSHGPNCDCHY